MLANIRFAVTGLFIGAWCVILFFVFMLRPTHPNNTWYLAQVFNFCSKYFLRIRVKGYGLSIRDGINSCIFVSNHQSNLDAFTCSQVIKKGTVSLGKTAIFWIPFFGPLYWLSGNVLINRKNHMKAMKSLDLIKHKMKEQGASLWIMPEGTRNTDQELLSFKKGAFVTAMDLGVPVVPVAISRYKGRVDFNSLGRSDIWVKYLDPISLDGKSKDDIPKIALEAQNRIQAELDLMEQG